MAIDADVEARRLAERALSHGGGNGAGAARADRTLSVVRACDITPRPVKWLWEDRLAVGTLGLLAGREGIGKSTLAYWLAAQVTRGELPGECARLPRAVIVAATEDSWESTIVPRLMAAGADLSLVLRVTARTVEGTETALSLPKDIAELESLIERWGVALLLLDPVISRLDGGLDTHKDSEVRMALEPIVAIADRTGAAVLGLIHVNKGGSLDPLTMIMGSRAFSAVSRAVLFALADPDDDGLFHLGQPKNNLGRSDLPTMDYRLHTMAVAETDEGVVTAGAVEWVGQSDVGVRELLRSGAEGADLRTATGEAADWLHDYLTIAGGMSASAKVKEEGRHAGHSGDALKRARAKLGVLSESSGYPRKTYWRLPVGAGSPSLAPTAPTAPTGHSVQSGRSTHKPWGEALNNNQLIQQGEVRPKGALPGVSSGSSGSSGLDPPEGAPTGCGGPPPTWETLAVGCDAHDPSSPIPSSGRQRLETVHPEEQAPPDGHPQWPPRHSPARGEEPQWTPR